MKKFMKEITLFIIPVRPTSDSIKLLISSMSL